MQLALIVQLSVALLAGELAGALPIPAWGGVLAALAAPLATAAVGAWRAAQACRRMDARDPRGPDAFFRFLTRAPWISTMWIALAACSELPIALEPSIGHAGTAAILVSAGVLATLAGYANAWTVERRLREAGLMRALDASRPVQAMPSRGVFVLAQARSGVLLFLAPLLVPLAAGAGARQLAAAYAPEEVDLAQVVGAVGGAAILFLAVPLVVPFLLGLRRLEAGEIRADLEALARDARVPVREIWIWPTGGLVANAAVMGLFPGLRCVMLSDCLLECMPREHIRAVMAHEIGHVARRHLPWLVVVILGCWSLAGFVATPVAETAAGALVADADAREADAVIDAAILLRDAAVLALGLLAFGYASRRFERQADSYAVQLLSAREGSADATRPAVDAMVGALGSVALLNHVPPDRPSWRHGSIRWRQEYLLGLAGAPHARLPIDRLVDLLKWGALAVVAVSFALDAISLGAA